MKFDVSNPPPFLDDTLRVGNVYRAKGGSITKYWVVVGLRLRAPGDGRVTVLGLDKDGEITSGEDYGAHVFESSGIPGYPRRMCIGRVEDLSTLKFNITWME